LEKGVFYGSNVKDAYVTPLTPPNVSSYLFSSNPTIHVYASALEAYQNSQWAEYGTIVGDLTDDIIDGISAPKCDEEKMDKNQRWADYDEAIFDLFGRKVTHLQPGSIYIKNGKKVLR
jgi:hypothetical protein